MKIRTKLMLALLGITLFVTTLGAVGLHIHATVKQKIDIIGSVNIKLLNNTTHAVLILTKIQSNIRKIIAEIMMDTAPHDIIPTGHVSTEIQTATSVIKKEINQLNQIMTVWEDEIRLWLEQTGTKWGQFPQYEIHELNESVHAITALTNQFLLELPTSHPLSDQQRQDLMASHLFFDQEMEPLFSSVHKLSHALFSVSREEMNNHLLVISQTMSNNNKIGIALTVISLLTAILLAYLLSRRIATPIELLKDAAVAVGKTGKFKIDLPLGHHDEIGQLANVLFSLFHEFEMKRLKLEDKEHELNRAARYLDKFLISMNDIIIVCSQKGDIEKINRPELLGYAKTALIGKPVRTLIKDHADLFGENNLQLLLKTGLMPSTETSLISLAGQKMPVLLTGSVLRDTNKEIMAIILAAKEISDYKKAQETLQKQEAQLLAANMANQTKSDFLATMSHEIRTPMNAVIGLTDLALHTNLTPKTRSYLVKIANASRSLLRIIDDILDFSKIEANKLVLELTDFVLRDVFDHLLDLFRQQMDDKTLDLVFFYTKEAEYALLGDRLRLEQILMNLISNAIKFTEQGSIEVAVKTIEATRQQVMLEFSVRDTGIGMTQEQTSCLFQPFQQADGSTTRKYGGSGLGLSICKRLVELNQGRIWVESIPEQGSVFRFTARFQRQATDQPTPFQIPEKLRSLKILIVDDNASSRRALQKMVQSFPFETQSAASGQMALAEIRKAMHDNKPFGLILVDWLMPEQDGIQVTHEILAIHPPMALPPKIILLTTLAKEESIRSLALAARINTFIDKPISRVLLFEAILEVFGHEANTDLTEPLNQVNFSAIIEKLTGRRILLVEDNKTNQLVASEILEKVGITLEIAENGEEAVIKVTHEPFDLVLMDIQMPIMDGLTACRLIRENPTLKNLPILAMTAHAMTNDKETSLAAGMNDHITKPIHMDQLYQTLIKWLPPRSLPVEQVVQPHVNPTQNHGPPLPVTIPGIDVAACLQRFNNNHESVWRVLLASGEDLFRANHEMRILLNGKRETDLESAQRLAHTIKGLSGTLAAYKLQQAAIALEKSILERRQTEWPHLLEVFEVESKQLMTSIQHLKETKHQSQREQPRAATIQSEDKESFKNDVHQLMRLIKTNDFKARRTFDTLRPILINEVNQTEMEQLHHHLARFDFKGAQKVLSQMMQTMNIPCE